MPAGPNSLLNVIIPTAWDGAELSRLALRDGTTYEAVIADINAGLAMVNADLQGGYLAGLMSVTEDVAVEYRNGDSNGFEDATEHTQGDAQRGDTTGHMLPYRKADRKMGWTSDWLEEARRAQIDADIASMLDDAKNLFEKRVLTRHFKLEEEIGRGYGLGASGVSVPFCDGGNGTIPFTPVARPARASSAFTTGHTHFLRLNGITQANVETAVKHLWEHGHDGPFDLLVSLADLSSWTNTTNVTGYVRRADPLVQYGQNTSLASVDAMYQGVVSTDYGPCRMYATGRVPTTYWSVFKSYGSGDQRNPLRVRIDPLRGFGVKLVTDRVDRFPLAGAIGQFRFGVGIGEDRTNGVCVLNAVGGSYSSPTIS